MKWFDRFFGESGPGHYRYDQGDEYPRHEIGRQGSGGWPGPNIFDDYGRRNGEGSSYAPDRHVYGRPYQYDTTPMYGDRFPYGRGRVSSEEDDRAIALALAEEEQHRRYGRPMNNLEEDEQLAKAMQESLNMGYRDPRRGPDYSFSVPPPPSRSSGMSVCAGCDEPLGYGRFLSCLGKNWHPNCFCCKSCNKPIADREFSVQGNEAYHRECYKERFHPKCEVCMNFIPTNAAGLIEYRSHPFWDQKYCPRHERDGTPRCCSCDRIETEGLGTYESLEDGRKVCLECMDSIVVDTKDCQPLYREILKFYENMGMSIKQEIPMLLVARSALNAARDGEKDGHTHTAETRGLCLSEEQTVTTVFGGKSRNPMRHMRTENHKLTRHCEVTAILVLYGLPRLLTGSILAHELMHAWLRLQGTFPHMRPEVEEGICQVMSHIWLTREMKKLTSNRSSSSSSSVGNKSDDIQARLGKFYLHQISTDSSPIYGGGYRTGIRAVEEYGLSRVLEHLRLTANFP